MTLKEKFENVLHNWINKDYDRQHVANELEIDADEFAIGFAEWLNGLDINDYVLQKHISSQELLEMYKKEKGL
jgi:hypothetical protein